MSDTRYLLEVAVSVALIASAIGFAVGLAIGRGRQPRWQEKGSFVHKVSIGFATLDRLDAPAGDAGTHGDVVSAEADKLPGRVRGGTGVMDTTLAAYKYAQEKWDPAWFNSVVIMTDGASDDSSSLSLNSLVEQLKSIRDPAKPVKVIIIGISQDSATGELEQIAAATGGQSYLVNNPNEILGVLAQALLNR